MKNKNGIIKIISVIAFIVICIGIILGFDGCASLDSYLSDLRGSLIGNSFDVCVYDNIGNNILNIDGTRIDVHGNYITEDLSDGEYSLKLSSVITSTIDGHDFSQVGNTVLYVEDGLEPVTDFSMPNNIETTGGTITLFDRNINKVKNLIGAPKTVVISSQLGVPLAVFSGESVYYDVPSDLPKMTKLMIDGKALYIHRANYMILDTEMIA